MLPMMTAIQFISAKIGLVSGRGLAGVLREHYPRAVLYLVGMAINFLGINPIWALVATAIINGLIAPPILVMVMLVSNNRQVMGERTNGWLLNVLGWGTTLVMAVASVALLITFAVG